MAKSNVTGIILAGGRSERMGTSKAWIIFRSKPMLKHIADNLSRVCNEVIVVASPRQKLPKVGIPVYRDKIPHQGPLGGIVVGLGKAKNEICFVSSCDIPLLRPEIIPMLADLLTDKSDCVMPKADGYIHPLCAIYRKSFL